MREQPNIETGLVLYHIMMSRYQIFKQIFDFGFPIRLYATLAQSVSQHNSRIQHCNTPPTDSLKLLDSYFQMNPTSIHMAFAQNFPPLSTNLCSTAIQGAAPRQIPTLIFIQIDSHEFMRCQFLSLNVSRLSCCEKTSR